MIVGRQITTCFKLSSFPCSFYFFFKNQLQPPTLTISSCNVSALLCSQIQNGISSYSQLPNCFANLKDLDGWFKANRDSPGISQHWVNFQPDAPQGMQGNQCLDRPLNQETVLAHLAGLAAAVQQSWETSVSGNGDPSLNPH